MINMPIMGEYNPHHLTIGSNRPGGPHPASKDRPVHFPEWSRPTPTTGYTVSNHTIGEAWPGNNDNGKKPPFKIIMMGAGAAGIDFLHHAPAALVAEHNNNNNNNVSIKCFDKNADVGGTWYENRYPGCACDGPSASYQFPWRPNPDWSRFYSGAREIWQYLKGIVMDEGLMKYIQLETEIKRAVWNDERSKWVLLVERTDGSAQWEEECDVFLNGTGFVK
jgi:cation diffusion facilitator CzcD-associated flavoprotein CzcO